MSFRGLCLAYMTKAYSIVFGRLASRPCCKVIGFCQSVKGISQRANIFSAQINIVLTKLTSCLCVSDPAYYPCNPATAPHHHTHCTRQEEALLHQDSICTECSLLDSCLMARQHAGTPVDLIVAGCPSYDPISELIPAPPCPYCGNPMSMTGESSWACGHCQPTREPIPA